MPSLLCVSNRPLEEFVSLSLEEVRQREQDAKKAGEEATKVLDKYDVLQQWYHSLGRALEQSGGPEPDFSFEMVADCYFIGSHDEAFIKSVIGDQLKEYGLELTTLTVNCGMEWAVWVCIGKPGQFDQYK